MRIAGVEALALRAVTVVAADVLHGMQRQIEHCFARAVQAVQRHGRRQVVVVGRVVDFAVGEDGRQLGGAQHAVGQRRGVETDGAQSP
ncbi:hypothetical protein D3C77_675540 [compost metagenome]